MPIYRVYNKSYLRGKPEHHPYVLYKALPAPSAEAARRKAERHNKSWSNAPVIKKAGWSAKVYKVVETTKRGTIKGHHHKGASKGKSWADQVFKNAGL